MNSGQLEELEVFLLLDPAPARQLVEGLLRHAEALRELLVREIVLELGVVQALGLVLGRELVPRVVPVVLLEPVLHEHQLAATARHGLGLPGGEVACEGAWLLVLVNPVDGGVLETSVERRTNVFGGDFHGLLLELLAGLGADADVDLVLDVEDEHVARLHVRLCKVVDFLAGEHAEHDAVEEARLPVLLQEEGRRHDVLLVSLKRLPEALALRALLCHLQRATVEDGGAECGGGGGGVGAGTLADPDVLRLGGVEDEDVLAVELRDLGQDFDGSLVAFIGKALDVEEVGGFLGVLLEISLGDNVPPLEDLQELVRLLELLDARLLCVAALLLAHNRQHLLHKEGGEADVLLARVLALPVVDVVAEGVLLRVRVEEDVALRAEELALHRLWRGHQLALGVHPSLHGAELAVAEERLVGPHCCVELHRVERCH
mmetsp:Transcript_20647/g.79125  ORF Transcript_20647/g.79125 Transcript_20647/m.79125 type:complete len:432 (-) Transcript_20647:1645-2940(-)